ncbi:MAG: TonB-dependent receptor plug [Chitinophagaceae bacterium]|jgi:iron complex outermembrane receptor protein|nr:TonB-dependent receptor plug [Chitinophagaceae bacterium]
MNLKRLLMTCILSLAGFALANAQDKMVTGKVTDSKDGTPVPGVTVMVKGTKVATQTQTDGTFRLSVPSAATTLVISSIGYTSQEVAIGSGNLNVSIVQSTDPALNEVVVVGYGTARKRDLTGSVATVTSKDFVKGPITTPEQLIAGKAPGVQITPNNGMPGSGSRIRIRGGTSLNASNDPLIVVDGVPLNNGGISGASNPLALINPNDIESITILKDASAAAIYGNRAANGVVIITTKKGASGKLKIGFSTLNSVSTITDKLDVMSAAEFRTLVNTRGTASDKAMLGTGSTDWQDEIYRTAFSSDNNISLSGGVGKLPYRLSLGYLNQDGVLKRSNMQRTSVGLNLSPKLLGNHLSVNANAKYAYTKNLFANQGAIGAAVAFDPTQPVMSGKTQYGGYYEWLSGTTTLNGLAPKNPVGLLNQREDEGEADRFIGNVQLDYKFHFLPDLHANLNLGLDRSHGQGTVFVPATAASDFTHGTGGRFNEYEQTRTNQLFESYFNYAKDITSIRSRIDAVAGYSWQDWKSESPSFPDLAANKTDTVGQAGVPGFGQHTLVSFYGRLNYSLMNKYLLTFTMRRDGSSRFSEDNRWGNFPSAAFAWNLKEEKFLKDNRVFSSMKLRLGWGITGQQEGISDYGYQPNFFYGNAAAQYPFGGTYVTVVRPQAYDENLKWEETESRNIGLDVGIMSNRFNFSLDYYNRNTTDLLAEVPAPAGTNFSNLITTNVGSTKSQGLEFGVTGNVINKKTFTLDLGYNLTYLIQNEITKLQLVNDPKYLGADVGSIGINGTIQKHSVGYSPSTFFLYKQVYDENDNAIEGLYEDRNRDGKIDELDKFWVRNPEPKVYMGFSANAGFGKFNAGFSMRANLDNYMYNNVKGGSAYYKNVFTGQNYLNNASSDVLVTNFNDKQIWSDYYLENASFLRMDNLFLNYNVGKVHKTANLRLNFNVQNVFVITKYSGLDPEQSGGIDGSIYPRPRMYAVGANLDF